METERRLMGTGTAIYADVSYTTTDLSPYSSTSSYSGDSSHNESGYYGEYDYQQGTDPNRMYYPIQDRMDIPMHNIYPSYTQTSHSDVYQPNALWHPQPVEVTTAPMTSVTSILPALNFCRPSEDTIDSVGPNGKPKRKRVQTHPQRRAANVRERKRMFHLNEAFDDLRTRLPAFNYEKRLSRIETLRLAITYIGFMKDVTDGKDPKEIKLAKDIHMDSFEMPGESPSSSKDPDSESE